MKIGNLKLFSNRRGKFTIENTEFFRENLAFDYRDDADKKIYLADFSILL
jgi:hypothetical protein